MFRLFIYSLSTINIIYNNIHIIFLIVKQFFRYLLSQATTGIQFTKDKFRFIPKLNEYDVTDKKLYSMFKLSTEEINEIETNIKDY